MNPLAQNATSAKVEKGLPVGSPSWQRANSLGCLGPASRMVLPQVLSTQPKPFLRGGSDAWGTGGPGLHPVCVWGLCTVVGARASLSNESCRRDAGLAEAHARRPPRLPSAAGRPPHLAELPVQHQRGDHAPPAVHDREEGRGEHGSGWLGLAQPASWRTRGPSVVLSRLSLVSSA